MNHRSQCQGFKIQNMYGEPVEACPAFWLNGVEISMSTIGYLSGGCLTEVAVFSDTDRLLHKSASVDDAVMWVIRNIK